MKGLLRSPRRDPYCALPRPATRNPCAHDSSVNVHSHLRKVRAEHRQGHEAQRDREKARRSRIPVRPMACLILLHLESGGATCTRATDRHQCTPIRSCLRRVKLRLASAAESTAPPPDDIQSPDEPRYLRVLLGGPHIRRQFVSPKIRGVE